MARCTQDVTVHNFVGAMVVLYTYTYYYLDLT